MPATRDSYQADSGRVEPLLAGCQGRAPNPRRTGHVRDDDSRLVQWNNRHAGERVPCYRLKERRGYVRYARGWCIRACCRSENSSGNYRKDYC